MITEHNVRDLFVCKPDDGVLFWKQSSTNVIKVGDRAGYQQTNGYRGLRYLNKYYLEHRLIWLHVHGQWPIADIDHINGIRNDNRIANLRPATRSQNICNSPSKKKNGGLKGAYYHKRLNRWHSQISMNGETVFLGMFDSEQMAHSAYVVAAMRLHGEFARLA